MYSDRIEAGHVLTGALQHFQYDNVLLLAVPRGGIPVAFVVAREFGFPLDLLLTKKIGHPLNPEYAIGAVSLTDSIIVPHQGVTEDYVKVETERIRIQLRNMYAKFMGDKEPEKLSGKTVIVIDDGVATGNTLIGTIKMLKKENPKKIIIAVPVATLKAVNKLSTVVNQVICPQIPYGFAGVSSYYENFNQVNDEEALFCLNQLKTEQTNSDNP
jgi:putative phosphoribosyl transferase